ncbi:E3 ubiquitin-protein ligase Os03g0188200 [Lolium perenne]|uniref:E3 ubiquitin-protein ligase Os03g0188200 n=1 Tax=Lolium perenne TaxID=4522 RepID=UPI0021F643D8|nr:E3 ubiquitin-protein ligase EL5-like [Lolium perenne]
MLPFPRAATSHAPDGHRVSSSASSPAFLAFVILLAALFLICLCSAAARRLCSRFSASASTRPLTTLPPRRCRGSVPDMDPAALAGSLPVRAYAGGATGDDVCAVCLGELQAQEQVKAIPACGHVFHPPCIDRWLFLAGTAGRASCPLCRCPAAALKPAAPAA